MQCQDIRSNFKTFAQSLLLGMCSVLDLSNERGLQRLIDYRNYSRLEREEEAALLALCVALNPIDLDGKLRQGEN